jgi:hypothetical protein
VRGVSAGDYSVRDFVYDLATYTATWTFFIDRTLSPDRLQFELDGDPVTGVTDTSANALDGEWADGRGAYPSGDGTAGGNFRMTLNVLAGDADRRGGRVNALDVAEVKRRLNTAVGAAGYSPFADLDSSGTINALDLTIVRRNLNHALPPAPVPAPVPVPVPAALVAPTREDSTFAVTAAILSA